MTDTLDTFPETIVPSPSIVTIDTLEAIGIDFEHENERLDRWRQTGECEGPTAIGTITVSGDAMAILEADMTDNYNQYHNYGTVTQANMVPAEDTYKGPSEESLAIMNEVQTEFEKIVSSDLSGFILDKDYQMNSSNMFIGRYQEISDDIHFDRPESDDVRYLVVIAGPGTTFFTGNFPSDHFNQEEGELFDGVVTPDTAEAVTQTTGVVLRFMSGCDPHNPPKSESPLFRILCDATIEQIV